VPMSAATYILEGRDADLTPHNGHQVEVTGTIASAAPSSGATSGTAPGSTAAGGATASPGAPAAGSTSSAPAASASSAASSGQRIQVASVKMISSTCPSQ
jgi:hypothetical protein